MDIKPHTRRAPLPPIDASLVVPGEKFPKNRAIHIGKPTVHDVVQRIEDVTDSTGSYQRVHYTNSETGRKGSMPMRDFCSGAEHRPPEIEPLLIIDEPAPDSGVQPTSDSDAQLARIESKLDDLLALARNGNAGPLFAARATR